MNFADEEYHHNFFDILRFIFCFFEDVWENYFTKNITDILFIVFRYFYII